MPSLVCPEDSLCFPAGCSRGSALTYSDVQVLEEHEKRLTDQLELAGRQATVHLPKVKQG